MSRIPVRPISVAAATFLIVACNQQRPDVAGPTGATPPTQSAATGLWGTAAEPVMIVEGSAEEPAGFKTAIFSDPKTDLNGEIRGTSPITVEYDACRSSGGQGGDLYFYFDWDFDHRADVFGQGDTCHQVHTYKARPVENAHGNEVVRTNICIANGDLRKHDPDTFVSCREFTIVFPKVAAGGQSCHAINTGSGGICPTGAKRFCIDGGIDPTSSAHARAACEACAGVGNCAEIPPLVWGSADTYFFYFDYGVSPCAYTIVAGDITDTVVGCFAGRWAP